MEVHEVYNRDLITNDLTRLRMENNSKNRLKGFLEVTGYPVVCVTILRAVSSQFPRIGFNEGNNLHLIGSALVISSIFGGINFFVSYGIDQVTKLNLTKLKLLENYSLPIRAALAAIVAGTMAFSLENRGFLPSQYKILFVAFSALAFWHVNYKNKVQEQELLISNIESHEQLELPTEYFNLADDKKVDFLYNQINNVQNLNSEKIGFLDKLILDKDEDMRQKIALLTSKLQIQSQYSKILTALTPPKLIEHEIESGN